MNDYSFWQVDIIENDQKGPHIWYTFRLERINREAFREAIYPATQDTLPLRNYVLCSEAVQDIIVRRNVPVTGLRLGLCRFKGFPDWHEVFLLDNRRQDND